LTDHVHFELLAQIIDGHKLQWPTTQDSRVVDEPGQRSIADFGARRRQLLGNGAVKTDRCQTAGAQPLGVLIATYTGQHREAALALMQCNRFADAAGRAGNNDESPSVRRHGSRSTGCPRSPARLAIYL
jgi:hypothetical protein